MEPTLTTADYALIISLASAFISLAGLAWNVWSKFIFPKPRLEVTVGHSIIVGTGNADVPDAVSVNAINHGPAELTLSSLIGWVGPERPFAKSRRAILRVFDDYPHNFNTTIGGSAGLPIRLKAGESYTVYLPTSPEIYRLVRNIGFSDGFGREHFSNRRGQRTIREFSKG